MYRIFVSFLIGFFVAVPAFAGSKCYKDNPSSCSTAATEGTNVSACGCSGVGDCPPDATCNSFAKSGALSGGGDAGTQSYEGLGTTPSTGKTPAQGESH